MACELVLVQSANWTQSWVFDKYPTDLKGSHEVQFRLVYRGPLHPAGHSYSREEKHSIRQHFHKQLLELWRQNSFLRSRAETVIGTESGSRRFLDLIADNHARCGYRFVPLVTKAHGIAASVEILFLRRDPPGYILGIGGTGGDIDNRLKVLLDAMKMPSTCGEIPPKSTPQADENPFFCVLEDDSLIAEVSIITDRLLTPQEDDERTKDVHLVLKIKTVVIDSQKAFNEYYA